MTTHTRVTREPVGQIQLYKPGGSCKPAPCSMTTLKRLLLVALLGVVFTGCTTPTITNLTPSRLPRKDNGQYPFSVEYYSRQETVIKDSMKAYVIVGADRYPMQRTPMLTNRWETLVPIPKDQSVLTYRYRFDYQYRTIPDRHSESKESTYYQLYLLDQ
jgi:hypothetical protein